MNRKELDVNLKSVSINELVDNLRSKLHSQIERSGFEFEIDCAPNLNGHFALVDGDGFLQVFINLVDNALKFSAKSDVKKIVLSITLLGETEVLFALRDFGPGIDKQHLSKIFNLFYRAENELTRETVGTGIGLALVNQLLRSMNGRVEAHNREPGAEFRVFLGLDRR
jgi:signal transduction histidine kinase